jgi:NAD+ diphosphatase
MERNFCYLCAGKLNETSAHDGSRWECVKCGNVTYPNPKPAVDAVLFDKDGNVLLSVRGKEPRKGMLNLLGGFMNINETVEEALARELHEEIGVTTADYRELTYLSSFTVDYPTKKETELLIVMIMTGVLNRTDLTASDDVAELVWKNPDQIEPAEMALGQRELDLILLARAKHQF